MFNLEKSIAEWRRQMIAGGIKSPHVLDELESHLREDVEQRVRSGVPAHRAFEEAVHQIGNADALKLEFAKVTPPGPRLSFNFQRTACIATALFVVLVETWMLFENEATRAERLLGLAMVWVTAAYIGSFPYLNRKIWRGVRGFEIRNLLSIVCTYVPALQIILLFLSGVANVVQLPSGIIFNVVFWTILTACYATALVLIYGISADILKLWTPAAMQAFEAADAEALRFHHDFVGTEHVLLGLMGIENSSVSKVLERLGVRGETVRAEIERIVSSFTKSGPAKALRCTPRAKKAMRIALREAKAMKRDCVDTDHLLLGLLREGSGVAAVVLKNLGVNPANAREEILKTCR